MPYREVSTTCRWGERKGKRERERGGVSGLVEEVGIISTLDLFCSVVGVVGVTCS